MTKAMMFGVIKDFVKASAVAKIPTVDEVVSIDDAIQFLDKEIELVNKRNSRKSGTSKKSKENEPIKDAIVEVLAEADGLMTTAEITNSDKVQAFGTEDKAISSNKVTALLVQLRKAGLVKREYVKKVAYFSLGKENEGEDTAEDDVEDTSEE
jgi:SpoU rRNA methylase family enzyme